MADPSEASRREFLKITEGLAGAGALGTLAGCIGGSDGDDSGGSPTSGGTETATIQFLSGLAAESSATKDHVNSGVRDFESKKGDVKVDLQVTSYSDLGNKISSTVQAENPPDLAESGSTGITFFQQDKVVDHGSYIEGTENLPDSWTKATQETARYRGEWWSAGQNRQGTTMLAVRPKLFKSAGVEDPSQLATWTPGSDGPSRKLTVNTRTRGRSRQQALLTISNPIGAKHAPRTRAVRTRGSGEIRRILTCRSARTTKLME